MALRPQTNSLVHDLLALGVVRIGTNGELYDADGNVLSLPTNIEQAAHVPDSEEVGSPTTAEFNALLASLRAANLLAPVPDPE